MRLLVIDNLGAGNNDATIYDLCRTLAVDGDEIVIRYTDSTTPIEELLDDATSFDAVIAAGGDGTVSSVAYRLAGTQIPLLPYPDGTANLIAANLDEPLEPPAFAQMLRTLDTLSFDIGEIDLPSGRRGFLMMAGAGYDAAIMEDAIKMKGMFGENAYFAAALANPAPTVSRFKLVLDGREVVTEGIAVILVNFGRIQFDISVTPGNNPLDGLFEVVVIKVSSGVQLLPALFAAIRDRDGSFPTRGSGMEIYTARQVSVSSDPALFVQYDGEPTGTTTPFEARVLPGAARIIVDRSSKRIRDWRKLNA